VGIAPGIAKPAIEFAAKRSRGVGDPRDRVVADALVRLRDPCSARAIVSRSPGFRVVGAA
jgi:hypothetical protein